ncbi:MULTISPECIES: helix-turn-helix domain-containing protein [unclassified Mesorhizobium]|uniref:helix-turn-helix domain-containing protein n=1 Tax=unclassified Mesorhizobium TaxID=325217 RepID=UPI00112B3BCC|nr:MULTISPECIES: helix-turn-helix domain-containing protein [unclassified Mesorhizobium]MBZ9980074.1 helix-turn-helix domain-containing protein [Mesorhizobium sp. BR-1-1-8]TPL29554.1 DDE-type integrase/transposase/recombinase [Mesorhizobium sp. B2-4-8]TPL67736.1 DDE-type integrase/transposase/recombinase [Mesorhizobium sp. B2-4-1]TPM08494.1 DDE-type integrase/transposase/recombinase [Mesorhizobium sp. B2-3-8]TPM17693.1 DDE-type integrase/transposase/recombinase [Mesorhizobium sp. B2-3-7]
MPWRECSVMEERLRFVARLLDGEGMSDVCREFGISRKTGYKIFNRYKDEGLEALTDRSRRPVRYANQLPVQIERMIVENKQEKPHWGARKIRELLIRKLAGDVRIPAKSTVHAVLDRHGLVSQARKRNRANKAAGTQLSQAMQPNDLWCADFKGEFKLGNGRYCYPLTVTDQASRYLLACEALDSTKEIPVLEAFVRLFKERGLPEAIRSDNGLPFASPNGLYNLSRLSVFWLRLGIAIERIRPGNPHENARHGRMHRTLKAETTRPPGMNVLQQQARFDAFMSEFNDERPHEAIGMKVPAELYRGSSRAYQGLPGLEYPFHDKDILVTACGRICMHRKKINISTVLAGQRLGISEVDDGIWLVSFMHYDLGYIDLEQRTLQTIDNPFGTRLSPMS